jgi:hypothetical protein
MSCHGAAPHSWYGVGRVSVAGEQPMHHTAAACDKSGGLSGHTLRCSVLTALHPPLCSASVNNCCSWELLLLPSVANRASWKSPDARPAMACSAAPKPHAAATRTQGVCCLGRMRCHQRPARLAGLQQLHQCTAAQVLHQALRSQVRQAQQQLGGVHITCIGCRISHGALVNPALAWAQHMGCHESMHGRCCWSWALRQFG